GPGVDGDLGNGIRSAQYNRSLDETRGIVQQQLGRVRAGMDLKIPDEKGALNKDLKLDDKARADLTSKDAATRNAAVDKIAHAIEDRKEFDRMYGPGSKGSYTNVDGKTQQEWLEQLNKPGASTTDKKQALDSLAKYTQF